MTEKDIPIEELRIPLKSVTLNVLASGDDTKPVMVFLHGFPSYSGVWRGLLQHFGQTYRCYAPDLRGYNLSDKPRGVADYKIEFSVADVGHLIEKVSPDKPVILVGHDFGGFLSYAFTSARPELVRALVVMNGPHRGALRHALKTDPEQVEASRYIAFLCLRFSWIFFRWNRCMMMLRSYREMMAPKVLTADEEQSIVAAWSQRRAIKSMIKWYRANRPALTSLHDHDDPKGSAPYHIKVPHLLIWGEDDPYLRMSVHATLDAYCKDLEKVTIADAGHAPYGSHPDQVIGSIEDFVARKL